ncbi:MAG: site-specific DNA-methyltransferase [Oscillospiraceae bacterium]|nr:site-specific DNA-methyltransferase [Oscillospiraceae bacterium]
MPTLDWIGKDKVVNHHLDVPYRVLERMYSYDQDGQHDADNGSENMIIHGDNLEALKSLLPQYEGRIKCIYIDPPYNTGNEGWVYNDNVNDPRMVAWINETVGKEGEDLSRHDKWLCMMYPRLRLLQKLLADDGCLAISIGYQEINHLMLICKEIFGTRQIMATTVKTSGGKPSGSFNVTNEYIVFILPEGFKANSSSLSVNEDSSPYHSMTLASFYQEERPNQVYPIYVDNDGLIISCGRSLQELIDEGEYTGDKKSFAYDYEHAPEGTTAVWPVSNKGLPCVWRQIAESTMKDWKKGYIRVIPQKSKKTQNKWAIQFLSDGIKKKIATGEFGCRPTSEKCPTLELIDYQTSGITIPTIWDHKRFYTTKGTDQIENLLGSKTAFNYAKPVDLVQEIIGRISDKDSIVLDSFAGSGTTAHAVLNANAADGGHRRFICIEMMDYAEEKTAERIKRVISGYRATEEKILFDEEITLKTLLVGAELLERAKTIAEEAKGQYSKVSKPKIEEGHLRVVASINAEDKTPGIPGDFSFYELGKPLFHGENLNEDVGIDKIREYVFFTETRQRIQPSDTPYYLGSHVGNAYYFYYEKDRFTTLDRAFLDTIDIPAAHYVIYADLCTLTEEELNALNITFKKIPRDITRL